jgi:hypothetical protein
MTMTINEYLEKIGHANPRHMAFAIARDGSDDAVKCMASKQVAIQWEQHPIVFKLPHDWVEPLKNVELSIPPVQYHQSYPSIMIQMPDGNCTLVGVTNVGGLRLLSLCHSTGLIRDGNKVDWIGATVRLDKPGITVNGNPTNFIEDAISSSENLALAEDIQSKYYCRIALNACLLLANYPTFRKRTDMERHLIRMRKHGTREKHIAAHKKLKLLPQVIDFVTRPRVCNSYGTTTDITKRPHWRKGHWRHQACGPVWKEHRWIFIEPVLIHGDNVEGGGPDITFRGKGML